MPPQSSTSRGFTLIEVLVVMTILIFIAGFALLVSMDSFRNNNFRSEQNLLIGLLQRARSQAMANINQSKHGVHIDPANFKYWIFEGDAFIGASSKADFSMGDNSEVNPGGASDVVFEQLTGKPVSTANLTLTNKADGKIFTVNVNNEGQINY